MIAVKFYCEINPVEHAWYDTKHYTCDYIIISKLVEDNIQKILTL